ncbi:MAG: YqgE/AlgH family protein [Desulfuromonadales bacterium]
MKNRLAVACTLLWLMATPALAVTVELEAGRLLVARPDLPDPRFRETVILLVQHGPAGTAGLILNRPSRLPLVEVLPELPTAPGSGAMLSYGGPVAPSAMMVLLQVHEAPPEPSQKVLDNVYRPGPDRCAAWLGETRPVANFRVFAGYGGWAPGQLEGELSRNDWRVLSADERLLFAVDAADLWQLLSVEKAGEIP